MLASWIDRVRGSVAALLRQGLSPEGIALALAFGLAAGIFPVIGATTIVALALGATLGLNQGAIQLANWFAYPLQLLLILPLVRLGEWLVGVPPASFAISQVVARVSTDPVDALATFGMTGLHGILGWLVVVPVFVFVVYRSLLPVLRAASRRLTPSAAQIGQPAEGEPMTTEAS